MEDYIEYLLIIKRYDDAAVHLVDIINDDKYVSSKEKSKYQVRQFLGTISAVSWLVALGGAIRFDSKPWAEHHIHQCLILDQ